MTETETHEPALPVPRAERVEKVLLALAPVGPSVATLVLVWHWHALPARVPVHFDLAGEADGWGSKGLLGLVLFLCWVMCAGLMAAAIRRGKQPASFNYPWPITAANAEWSHRGARRMLAGVGATASTVLAAGVVDMVVVASDGSEAVSGWILGAGLLAVVAWPLAFCLRGVQLMRSRDEGGSARGSRA